MARPIKSSTVFDGLPRCIVCGHPILRDQPSAQFTDGVAHVKKRQGRARSCKTLAEGGERMIKGLAIAGDDWLPGTIKPPSGAELYATEMAKQRGGEDGQDSS